MVRLLSQKRCHKKSNGKMPMASIVRLNNARRGLAIQY